MFEYSYYHYYILWLNYKLFDFLQLIVNDDSNYQVNGNLNLLWCKNIHDKERMYEITELVLARNTIGVLNVLRTIHLIIFIIPQ